MNKGGNFSNLTNSYQKARKGYSASLFSYLNKEIARNNPHVLLDLGCGTGSVTRKLAYNNRIVIGCDPDEEMIRVALQQKQSGVSYCLGTAGDIPFNDDVFDVVTCFGAFHWVVWYEKDVAMMEIQRVLKSNGLFCVINKVDTGLFTKNIKEIIQKYSKEKLLSVHSNYHPEEVLEEFGFRDISVKKYPTNETFTSDRAVQYAQSMSAWNYITPSKREQALAELKNMFNSTFPNRKITREMDIKIVKGVKL